MPPNLTDPTPAANLLNDLRQSLTHHPGATLESTALNLLAALGYRSRRQFPPPDANADGHAFTQQFPAPTPGAPTEQDFARSATAVRLLFQFTDTEIANQTQQPLLADAPESDPGNARSFLFAAVQLSGPRYPRGRYAAFTREINKRFPVPAVVLFRTAAGRLTLAFVHRRASRTRPDRDVLGHVSLIREIDPANPHRAHLDILAQLSLPERLRWIDRHGQPRNFDGLLAAWLDALDTEELNRRFYRDLFAWFEHALANAQFPAHETRTQPPEEHVIRLITRLLFVWFLKEKGLVAEDLFIENQIAALLTDYDRDTGDSWYRAVLQNLFFATLNTPIPERGFSGGGQPAHRVFSRYRYANQIADRERLLQLLAQTPFINGGLFDCLDSEQATTAGGYRIDCFSDVHYRHLSLPNRLFFGDDPGNPGLIDLFNRYKFTVEENTPAEQEVALDPELLGKVFENLLAAVNPETRLTARKETGSYYTPRAVVDYMVDEALIGALSQKTRPDNHDTPQWQERLRQLLDYADPQFAAAPPTPDTPGETANAIPDAAPPPFSPAETAAIVTAIANLKILDPAVGSGAFPMGALHKLTLALRRLDPDNRLWEALQKDRAAQRAAHAFNLRHQPTRDAELQEISDTFETYRDSDYGRKLYLIQNSIYGVDLQPIAAQIAKLRFFISLAIEQQPSPDPASNYGVRPLPNLESRFVAADTLQTLARPAQRTLGQTAAVTQLEREIAANRERHFHATARQTKLACRHADHRLRQQLAQELQSAGFPAASANQIAQWEPFDQNAPAAPWFDPEYMFGVPHGFDIVIANPPYVRQEEIAPKAYKDALLKAYPNAAVGRSDLYCYFYARALQLLAPGGMHLFVCSNSWLDVGYGAKLQQYLLTNAQIEAIYESAIERQFITADINTIISVIRKPAHNNDGNAAAGDDATRFVQLREDFNAALSPNGHRREIVKTRAQLLTAATANNKFVGDKWGGKYLRAPDIYHHILDNYNDKLVRLGDIATVRFGIKTGANDFFYLTDARIAQYGIEPEYCHPVMTTPQESRRLAINPADLPKRLFMCHQEKADLKGTGALAYIEWGESQNYHQRTSVATRRRWYDLGDRDAVPLAINRRIDTTSRAFIAEPAMFVGDTLYEISAATPNAVCAALNSTLTQLIINVEGRANFGAGVLEIEVYETANLAIPNPSQLPPIDPTLYTATAWDALTPSPQRRELDAAIFAALDLPPADQQAVYAGVAELVTNRKRRARSATARGG